MWYFITGLWVGGIWGAFWVLWMLAELYRYNIWRHRYIIECRYRPDYEKPAWMSEEYFQKGTEWRVHGKYRSESAMLNAMRSIRRKIEAHEMWYKRLEYRTRVLTK